jgi:WD40 repeat protein
MPDNMPDNMPDPDALLKSRGFTAELGANIITACFNRAGTHCAFALGDGRVVLTDNTSWSDIQAHAGAVLSLAPHPATTGFLSGGDDGKLNALALTGEITTIAAFGSKWVEHITATAGKTPTIAAAIGKNIHLYTATHEPIRTLPHPSTVTGITFDAKGKRIAASHYNGASLWFTASTSPTPRLLEWKGSHTGIALHPAGEALVTSMQENALHGWTLPEGKHMRMSGYPAKTESFGFTKSGRWLVTGGADAIVLWPFFGGGPMGKPPTELAQTPGGHIIKQIACHPEHEITAAGFSNGLTILADITKQTLLPLRQPTNAPITTLAWNPTGSHLALATESGFAAVVDFAERAVQ